MKYLVFAFLLFCVGLGADEQAIKAVLNQWPKDFNNKNASAVCGLFAHDLVASYPGTKDRNYEDMCSQLTAILKHPTMRYTYEQPEIEQIIHDGDLAAVRLIWTLKVYNPYGILVETIREKGLDVFRKQDDDAWKISISYAYPLPE